MPESQPFHLLQDLRDQLVGREQEMLRRIRRSATTACSPHVRLDGREMLAFASNDYLGLAAHSGLGQVLSAAIQQWGTGSGASHLVSGHTTAHDELDQRLANFVGMDAALSFATGYLANIAVMPALVGRGDAIFSDKLNHASLLDGAMLSRAELLRYPHNDVAALARALVASTARRKLIVSDAVFSMDGDIAPLPELLALARQHQAWLLIDDAHGFGVLGPQGRGALAAAGLQDERLILMATLGKAAGMAGAFIAGQRDVIEWLMQTSRAYIFTTAQPPAMAQALQHAVQLIAEGDALRSRLQELALCLRSQLKLRHWQLLPSTTAIQPILIGENDAALRASQALWQAGIWVPAIRPPTVPVGTARLRISLSAAHSLEDVERLAATLNQAEQDLSA